MDFAGGDLIIIPYEQASSANLTPDPSGISYYDESAVSEDHAQGKAGCTANQRDHAVVVLRPDDG